MGAAKWMAGVAAAALMAGQAHADLVITTKATQNVSCSKGICTATAANAALNVSDLTSMLAGGDVKVLTGGGATNIAVNVGLSWTSTSRLTLDAKQSITIIRPVTVAGMGAVTIATNDGGSGGDLMFAQKGEVNFWDTSSSLIINGQSYTLANSIAMLASDIAANASGFYALANDYDASVDGTYTASPIATAFDGTFEGLGHGISNLKINSAGPEVGLFATVKGSLRDLGVLSVWVKSTGNASDVGALLARSDLATIVGCYATGSVHAGNAFGVGGLVGVSNSIEDGTLTRSHSAVSVSAGNGASAGGLVGGSGFSITLSYATGDIRVKSDSFAGGLLGTMAGGKLSEVYSTGEVVGGSNGRLGGLVGSGSGEIDNAYSTGSASGDATGTIGGFIGQSGGLRLQWSYSIGRVKGKNSGGFLGSANGNDYLSDYWDTDTSGKGKKNGCPGHCPAQVKGLKTPQFQSALPKGFDPAIWVEEAGVNGGFPYLRSLPLN